MWTVTEDDIHQWASHSHSAENVLPDLVRRLMYQLTPQASLSFPAYKATRLGGYDGVVLTPGPSIFAPTRESVWELSVRSDIVAKANQDYSKRTAEPLDRDKGQITYVALTGRRWASKKEWESQKQKESEWGYVRAYDATDIAQWLSAAPSVLAWFTSDILGRPIDGINSVRSYFENWRHRTQPPLNEAVVTAGRDMEVKVFHDWLREDSGPLWIKGDTLKEGIIFACAAILQAESDEREAWLSRAVIVTSQQAWHRLMHMLDRNNPSLLILLPDFETFDGSLRHARKNYLLLSSGKDRPSNRSDILLAPISRPHLIKTLIPLLDSENNAERIARESGGKLTAVQRLLGYQHRIPVWARSFDDSLLSALLLAGSWVPNNVSDQKALLKIAGVEDFDYIERRINELLTSDDAPLRTQGKSVKWRSIRDAWQLIGARITTSDINRFEEACLQILTEYNPKYDLPISERIFAPIRGQQLVHSPDLRTGLIQSLAWLALHLDTFKEHHRAQQIEKTIHEIIQQVLTKSWKMWATLGETIPTLAEASPVVFLNRVEYAIVSADSDFQHLFFQDPKNSGLSGECAHCGLLRALEVLSWHPDHFPQVADILARLCDLDRGGLYSNRPANVLLSMFHPVAKQTNASYEARIAVLRSIVKRHGLVGWNLLQHIMETYGGRSIIMPNKRPEFLEWNLPPKLEGVSYQEQANYYHDVIELIFEKLKHEPQLLLDLLTNLQIPINLDLLTFVSSHLESFQNLETGIQAEIQNGLRSRVANWTYFEDSVTKNEKRIELASALIKHLDTGDAITNSAWLFTNDPPLPEEFKWDWKEKGQHIQSLRKEALKKLLESTNPVEQLLKLAAIVENSKLIGWALGDLSIDFESTLINMDLSKEGPPRNLALGFVASRSVHKGSEWLERIVHSLIQDGREADAIEALVNVPGTPKIRQFIHQQEEPIRVAYWKRVGLNINASNDPDLESVVENLVEARRWDAAVNIASRHTETEPQVGKCKLYLELLQRGQFVTDEEFQRAIHNVRKWDIARIFKRLDKCPEVNKDEIASLEVFYLNMLTDTDRPPKHIMKQLEQSPEFYAELISLRFKPRYESHIKRDPHEQERIEQLAMVASNIWEAWNGYPGQGLDEPQRDDFLRTWCEQALALTKDADREILGQQQLGEILSRVPPPESDGIWPCLVAREYIEDGWQEVVKGLEIGKYNLRGFTSRALDEGGRQERELAEKYREDAMKLQHEWIKTAAFLKRIAEKYEREAIRYDVEAEKFADP